MNNEQQAYCLNSRCHRVWPSFCLVALPSSLIVRMVVFTLALGRFGTTVRTRQEDADNQPDRIERAAGGNMISRCQPGVDEEHVTRRIRLFGVDDDREFFDPTDVDHQQGSAFFRRREVHRLRQRLAIAEYFNSQ